MNIEQLRDFETKLNAAIEAGEVMDAYQVADILGIHHNGVLRDAKRGRLGCVRFGRTYYFTLETVARWRDGMKFTRR
jgi:hypothetical protein